MREKMASNSSSSSLLLHSYKPTLTYCSSKPRAFPKKQSNIPTQSQKSEPSFGQSRRGSLVMFASTVASIALSGIGFDGQSASGLDFGIMAPDQTFEEAESGIRGHIDSLLQVKALIDSESWREARSVLRRSASYVKRDFYTIIQSSPPSQRPRLRKLYFDLFNNVSKLDYAAKDKDISRVLQCYDNIVVALNDILSRI